MLHGDGVARERGTSQVFFAALRWALAKEGRRVNELLKALDMHPVPTEGAFGEQSVFLARDLLQQPGVALETHR